MPITDQNQRSKLQSNRRAWVIRDLLDKPKTPTDILKIWRYRGKIQYEEAKNPIRQKAIYALEDANYNLIGDYKIGKPKKLKNEIGISKSDLSKIINGYDDRNGHHNGLEDEGIIKKRYITDKLVCCLVENEETLYKILTEFNNPIFSDNFKIEMLNDLIKSEYAQKLINMDLVKKIGYLKDEEELNFVLYLVKIYPSALLELLKEIKRVNNQRALEGDPEFKRLYYSFLKSETLRRSFLMKLHSLAQNDFNYFSPAKEITIFNAPVEIEFEIKATIKTEKGDYVNKFKMNSGKILSKEERDRANESSILKLWLQITNLESDEYQKLDKRFHLDSSPLKYEK